MASKSALRRDPSKPPTGGGLTQSLRRVSPGIYRNAGGQLTNQAGRPMPQQPNRPPPQQQWQPTMAGAITGVMGNENRPGSYGPNMSPEDFANAAAGNANMVNLPAQLPPGANPYDYGAAIAGYDNAAGQIHDAMWRSPGYTDMMYRPPGYNQNAGQMPQPSANKGGKYRLSPGVYGTREQAMRQYEMNQPQALQGAYDRAMPNQVGQGPGNFIGQQRERELGYVENRFNAVKNNNLFTGNPIKRFKF